MFPWCRTNHFGSACANWCLILTFQFYCTFPVILVSVIFVNQFSILIYISLEFENYESIFFFKCRNLHTCMHLPSLHHKNSNIPLCHPPEIQPRLIFHCHPTEIIIFEEMLDKLEVYAPNLKFYDKTLMNYL